MRDVEPFAFYFLGTASWLFPVIAIATAAYVGLWLRRSTVERESMAAFGDAERKLREVIAVLETRPQLSAEQRARVGEDLAKLEKSAAELGLRIQR